MTLEQYIESEAQRLFAALGARHGRDIHFYRLLAKRCIAPTQMEMQQAIAALRQVEEFLGREPVRICYDGIEHLSPSRRQNDKHRIRRNSQATATAALRGAKCH